MTEPASLPLSDVSWPAASLNEAMRGLAREARLVKEPPLVDRPAGASGEDLEAWFSSAGARLRVEIVPVSSACGELEDTLRAIGPSLLRLPGPGEARFLVVVRSGRNRMRVLTPEAGVRAIDTSAVMDALMGDVFRAEQAATSALLSDLELSGQLGERGLRAFTLEQLGKTPVEGIWLVRPSPASDVDVHARGLQAPALLALIVASRAASMALSLLLWWLIGQSMFGAENTKPAMGLLALCALSTLPFRLLDAWAQSRLALDVGALFKEALLHGVLHLDRSETRGRGAGQFLDMVMEGEVSSTAMTSGLSALGALVDIVTAMVVLSLSVGGYERALLLVGWLGLSLWLCARYAEQRTRWVASSRSVTGDLVERIVGYQTRLVQERPDEGRREEDAVLHDFLVKSQEMDRRALWIGGFLTSGWLLVGFATLEPYLVSGGSDGAAISLAIGGIFMAGGALQQFVGGITYLIDVGIAWQQTGPILRAGRAAIEASAAKERPPPRKEQAEPSEAPLLQFKDLSVRYRAGAPEAIRQCSQAIAAGDRVLLEGPSGGGKSTLALVLAGMRAPDAGSLWLRGEPREDLADDQWRARIVLVPQFHENHILTGSLLFNLLLGRRWPPSQADVVEAAAVCDLLGLRPLVERMPQGLSQPVGDGGWALSHGERSRVFLARSLLQEKAELLILDESFSALDPETLRVSCQAVIASAPTLLIIAHP